MGKIFKALAIFLLLVTIVGAGVMLYGVQMLTPKVEFARVETITASEAPELFEQTCAALDDGTFTGRFFAEQIDAASLEAEQCTFLRYSVRLRNRGFFPAEWISLTVIPKDGDLLMIGGADANVLAAGTQGDLSVTVLHEGDGVDLARTVDMVCYVFGQKISLAIDIQ